MADVYAFLEAFALVICAAGVASVLFRWIRQPVVLGYILAGLVVGPYVPIPIVADPDIVRTLSELGVIFLMFALGLEFSLRRLAQVASNAGVTAVIQSSLMLGLGYLAGRVLGWDAPTSFFAGAMVAISSTTIIAKAFDEQKVGGRMRELVIGVLIVEDLLAILLLAVASGFIGGEGVSLETLTGTGIRLVLILAALLALGILVVPGAIGFVRRRHSAEATLLVSLGMCVGLALLAHELGYSVALGAFVAGSLIAESGAGEEIEHLVRPVRDLFAAVFFVSVGMLIDPAVLADNAAVIALFTVLVLVGKTVGTAVGAFLAGNGTQVSVRAGMSLAQIGEFSFIIAGAAMALGGTAELLYPIAVSVSAITTLTTPLLIRASARAASAVDALLPRALQTFATLYASWIEQLRAVHQGPSAAARRLLRRLVADAAVLILVIAGTAIWHQRMSAWLAAQLGLSTTAASATIIASAALISLPFCWGIFRIAQRLGMVLAESILPRILGEELDYAAAPRRALVVTLQLAVVLLLALAIFAITQPFLPLAAGAIAVAAVVALFGVAFWRRAADLHGHVKAAAQAIVEALAARAPGPPDARELSLQGIQDLLPGLGNLASIQLDEADPAIGRSLADLDLRGRTGATILAIVHREGHVVVPTARETLQAGDLLALTGSSEAVSAAIELLKNRA